MDKQKQIEEMAKALLNFGMATYPTGDSAFTETKLRDSFYHVFLTYAEHLYNAGYRKIPEGAVVLTGEEYSDYLEMQNNYKHVSERCKELHRDNEMLLKGLGNFKKEVQKKTAEKFAERVKMAFYYEFDELIPSIMADKIDEICK